MVDGVVLAVHNYAEVMNRTGYCCVVTPRPARDYDDSDKSYKVIRTNSLRVPISDYALPLPRLDSKLKDFLAGRRLDIVHAHSPFTEGAFAAYFAKKAGIPCVTTFHSKYYDDVINLTGSKVLANIVTKKIVRFYNSVDSVWTVSDGAVGVLRTYGYRGDVRVVKNGTTYTYPDQPAVLRQRAAEAFSIPSDKRILLFVGHQFWHKNLKLVLDTFRLLADHSGEYRLLIVGEGYDAKAIGKYAESLKFPDGFVRFLGRVGDRDLLAGLYLLSDLFFFPSVYDTSGLVVHEAASLGLPSLLTAGSNAAEAVVKDVSGFTAEENKVAMFREILHIFGTEGLLEKVGEGARRDVGRSWKEIIPEVQELYAEIIEEYRYKHKLK